MTPIDLLIQPKALLAGGDTTTSSPEEIQCLLNWGVAISGRQIVAVDTLAALEARYRPQQTLALPNHLVMPGLINAQTHALGITTRGQTLASDVFAPSMNPAAETGPMSLDEFTAAARLAFSEMLLAGTTTCADMSPYPEQVAKAAEEAGIHAQVSVPITDEINAWSQSAQDGLERALALHDGYAHHPSVGIALGLPNLAQISFETLQKVGMYSEELNLQVQALLHPTPGHVLAIEERHGCDGVTLLERAGLLGPNLQAVHVNALDDDAMALLHRYRVALVRCHHPFSGQMRPWDWMHTEQPVGLGTGSYALNYYADAFRGIEQQGLIGINRATRGSATALGLETQIGTLKANKLADVIALDLRILDPRSASAQTTVDLPSLLTRGRGNQAVTHVWVAGQLRVDNRELV
jgi:5-methylthioadenosine/S-adenosylhomocysteine deaminase